MCKLLDDYIEWNTIDIKKGSGIPEYNSDILVERVLDNTVNYLRMYINDKVKLKAQKIYSNQEIELKTGMRWAYYSDCDIVQKYSDGGIYINGFSAYNEARLIAGCATISGTIMVDNKVFYKITQQYSTVILPEAVLDRIIIEDESTHKEYDCSKPLGD